MSIRELIVCATKAILPTRLVSLDKVSSGDCIFVRIHAYIGVQIVSLACFEDELRFVTPERNLYGYRDETVENR